jgi:hypothetical protein
MNKRLEEAQQGLNNTNLALFEQTETLEQIEDKCDDVGDNIHKSNFLMRGIKSFGGSIWNLFSKPKKVNRAKKQKQV